VRFTAQFAGELSVLPDDVTVKIETNKQVENGPTRRVLQYFLPDGRMRYCDTIAAATTMSFA
jgi:hypothetical protein